VSKKLKKDEKLLQTAIDKIVEMEVKLEKTKQKEVKILHQMIQHSDIAGLIKYATNVAYSDNQANELIWNIITQMPRSH